LTIEIKIIDNNLAQVIWKNSHEANIFNHPEFLSSFSNIVFYGCYIKNDLVAVWPIYKKNKDLAAIPWNFYYFGPYIHDKINFKQLHSKIQKLFDIYEAYFLYFKSLFKEVNFSQHWNNQDIRYFKWLEEKYDFLNVNLEVKYTALIENGYEIKNWRHLRVRQLKKIFNLNDNFFLSNEKTHSISDYLSIIKEKISENEFIKNKNLYKLMIEVCQEKGFCTNIIHKASNELLGFACVLEDKISHHMVLNFVKNDWKKKGLMVFLYKNLFEKCFDKNLIYFDFNGANSFKGAEEKSTYGTMQKLYFNVNLKYN
jgi:hypothetical protein